MIQQERLQPLGRLTVIVKLDKSFQSVKGTVAVYATPVGDNPHNRNSLNELKEANIDPWPMVFQLGPGVWEIAAHFSPHGRLGRYESAEHPSVSVEDGKESEIVLNIRPIDSPS